MTGFQSGDSAFDNYLKTESLEDHKLGSAKTWSCVYEGKIVGYVTISMGLLADPKYTEIAIPGVIINRLAVDMNYRGRGIGVALINFVTDIALEMQKKIGCQAIIAKAENEYAETLYRRTAFLPAPSDDTLFVKILIHSNGFEQFRDTLKD